MMEAHLTYIRKIIFNSDPDFNKVYDNTKQMVKNLSNDKFLNKSRSFIVDNFSKKVATIKILETYKTLVK